MNRLSRGSAVRGTVLRSASGRGSGNGGRNNKKPTDQGDRNGGGGPKATVVMLAAASLHATVLNSPALAAELEDYVDSATELLWPILSNMGFSGVMGLCAAAALKFLGKLALQTVGLLFIVIQLLIYQGFISVNWSHVQDKTVHYLDRNRDNKLDEKDLKAYLTDGMGFLSAGVPSVAGFLIGFQLGLKI